MTEPRLVIWVEFTLQPGTRAQFLDSVKRNAASSVQGEPGCRRFDVMVPQDGEDTTSHGIEMKSSCLNYVFSVKLSLIFNELR